MIYQLPPAEDEIDQGDLIDECPIFSVDGFDINDPGVLDVRAIPIRVVVLTQTCDLANKKARHIAVAPIHEAKSLVEQKLLKTEVIRGSIRAGQVFG
jgi:hypothetical protein